MKIIAQWFRSKGGQQPVLVGGFGWHQVHHPKPARVVKDDSRAVLHGQNHVVVFLRRGVVMHESPLRVSRNRHPPGHAQMDQQGLAAAQIGEDVFGASAQSFDPLPGQPLGHAVRERPAQIGAVDLGAGDHLTLHRRGKAGPDGFDFGQFGHLLLLWHLRALCLRAPPYIRGETFGRQYLMTDSSDKTTHFGSQTIPEADKAGRVQGVFNSVASKYDVMNDVMSMGVHRIWKDAMMDWLAPRRGQKLLDVAGGTGDIAFRFLKRAGAGHATVLDLTEPMLIAGRKRAEADQMQDSLDWIVGDAMALPFAANTFDVYTISFGIRNVTRPQEALNEAFRVLKPGGRLMVLEFSQLPNAAMQKAYDLYSFNVIPRMGQMIAGDRDSYQYLIESIRNFPDQDTFLGMLRTAGFENTAYRNLSFGIAALHSGWKI